MHRACIHHRAGLWPGAKATACITLDFDARHHRRIRLTTDQGEDILLDLPKAVALTDGDALQLDDGRLVKVTAAPERVVEVMHKDRGDLIRLAWHLGNRHLATEIGNQFLRIRPDRVIEEMLRSLGAELASVEAPFQPEGGAYRDHVGHHQHGDERLHHDR